MTTAVAVVADDHSDAEMVVLLDEQLSETGVAPKASVHTADTPLHLAFSCYVFGPDGRVLLTRRALGKKTWPGVWTNTFCGHPGPGEPMADAVARRGRQELGLTVTAPRAVLPNFRYRAVDASGIVWRTSSARCGPPSRIRTRVRSPARYANGAGPNGRTW
ncbi:isopentenyl-diphosphate Delta-isomerase [Saccharopolyspora sp. NPDC000995]